MAEPDHGNEPPELAAYRAMLKEAARIAAAAEAQPNNAELKARAAAEVKPVNELQRHVTARATSYTEIATGTREFQAFEWRLASAIPRTQEQALAVLAADSLKEFRDTRAQLDAIHAAQRGQQATPQAPITAEHQDLAARQAQHLFPARMLEPQPIPQPSAAKTQEEILRQRVTNAQLHAEQPHIRNQISPQMQERGKEPEAVPPTSITRKLRDFVRRQTSDTALEERYAKARENETPHNIAHHAARQENQALVDFANTLSDPPAPAIAPPQPAREGYQTLSAGVETTHTVTAKDLAQLQEQQLGDWSFLEPAAHGKYEELGVYRSPLGVQVQDQQLEGDYSFYGEDDPAVPLSKEMTEARATKQAKAAERTGVSARTTGQGGAVHSNAGSGKDGGSER